MKPYTLTTRDGESISPMTSTKTVFDPSGVDLDTLLDRLRQECRDSLVGYAKKTEVSEALSDKQDSLSTTTDLHITDDGIIGLTETAKRRLFDDMWDLAWKASGVVYGKYDPENAPDAEHPYLGNGIWMTYEEAVDCLLNGHLPLDNVEGRFMNTSVRTNIPRPGFGNGDSGNLRNLCNSAGKLEVFRFSTSTTSKYIGKNLWCAFYGCWKLREIRGEWGIYSAVSNGGPSFAFCQKLEYIEHLIIGSGVSSLSLSDSPLLNYDTLERIARFAETRTTSLVITLHADTFAKVCGDTTNEAAAALTPEELAQWTALPTAAAAKNITFAEA